MRLENQAIQFRYSPKSMIALTFLGLGMTGASGALAFRLLPKVGPGSFAEFVGYCGVLFFGAATVLIAWRLVTAKGPVVVITGTGFTDHRLAPEEIPWTAFEGIATATVRRQKLLVLDIDPQAEAKLHLTRTVRWSRQANAALGIRGLTTTAQGLDVAFETLLDLCVTRVRNARSGSSI